MDWVAEKTENYGRFSRRSCIDAVMRVRVHEGETTGTAGCHLLSSNMKNGKTVKKKVSLWQSTAAPAPIHGGPQWRTEEEPKADFTTTPD